MHLVFHPRTLLRMLGLPDEILLNIFSGFKPFNVLPFRRVCMRWRCIIDTSITLQLQIECLLDGRNLPAPGNSWAGELQKIRQSNLAWETLIPTKQSNFKVNDVKGSHLLLHNGLVGLSHESGRILEMWEYHDVTGFQSTAKHTHIGFHPELYTFDRAQDVLVLLENMGQGNFKLHIRQLSTDGRHQGAAKAAIILGHNKAERSAQVEIHGNHVAVLIQWRINLDSFFLVDWKEGTILLNHTSRIYDFCFIDARTILLAISAHGRHFLRAIFLPLDRDHATPLSLHLPGPEKDYHLHSLELKTDCGRLIGICVGVDKANTRDPDSDFLLVIDRRGLLKFLAGTQLAGVVKCRRRQWDEWESGITTILPLKNNSHQMAWAVFGRRIVINAEAETLPFAKSAMQVADANEVGNDGHKNDEDQGSEGQEGPDNGQRLIVVNFGCHRLPSVVEAGDASGNIIRSCTRGGSLPGIFEFPSKELPYRIWMERVPSCLPNEQVHMSESTVLVVGENDDLIGIRSIRVF